MRREKRRPCEARRAFSLLALGTVTLLLASPSHVASQGNAKITNSAKKDRAKSGSTKKSAPVPKGSCVSQGGRFLPFASHGKKPKKSPKGKKGDLSFCRVYKESTCCDRVNSDAALLSLRMLQLGAEPTDLCQELWEALECSVCHPSVGTQPGPPAICASFCDRLFSACKSAFFANDPVDKVFLPCSSRDSLCSRGTEWVNSSGEFCRLTGYDVINITDIHAPSKFCFDGKLAAPAKGQGTGKGGGGAKGGGSSGGDEGTFFGEKNVYWAVGGLVLTAGLLWGWHTKRGRKRRAAVMAALRDRERAEARDRQQAEVYYATVSRRARKLRAAPAPAQEQAGQNGVAAS